MQTEKEYIAGREINDLRCESVGEYSLPDYNGDVKKVLFVKSEAYPSGKFVGEDTLEFSGSVGYEVVYVDGENNVTHAEFSTDYEATVRINSEKYVDSDVHTTVSSCNMRLIGPRKFSVKSSLDSEVRISERRTHSVDGDAFMEYDPEIVSETANVFTPCFASGDTREFSEQILEIDGAIVDEVEALLCEVEGDVSLSETGENSVTVKGSLNVDLLYRDADNVLRNATKEIPYFEDLMIDDVSGFGSLDARVEVINKKFSVAPTDSGVALTVSLSVAPKVYARKNTAVELVSDAYLKERGTENEYVDFNYTEHICMANAEDKFTLKQPLSELEIDSVSDVFSLSAVIKVDNCEIDADMAKINGEIRFNGIACQVSDSGDKSYLPVRFLAPYEQNVNLSCQKHGNMRVNCSSYVSDVKAELVDNTLEISYVVIADVTVNSDKRQRCIGASYATDEEYTRDDSVVTVYYPDASETLFGIAKKFHTSVSAIAECNSLSESVFSASRSSLGTLGVGKLLIK